MLREADIFSQSCLSSALARVSRDSVEGELPLPQSRTTCSLWEVYPYASPIYRKLLSACTIRWGLRALLTQDG